VLTRTLVPFRYVESGAVDLRKRRAADRARPPPARCGLSLQQPLDRPPLDLAAEDVAEFYAAYRRFAELLHDPSLTVGFPAASRAISSSSNNRRVLHGRRGSPAGAAIFKAPMPMPIR